MCGVCEGRGVVKDTVVKGAYLIKRCPVCKPKNKRQLDIEMEIFNKRLSEAIKKHEEEKAHVGVHSA